MIQQDVDPSAIMCRHVPIYDSREQTRVNDRIRAVRARTVVKDEMKPISSLISSIQQSKDDLHLCVISSAVADLVRALSQMRICRKQNPPTLVDHRCSHGLPLAVRRKERYF